MLMDWLKLASVTDVSCARKRALVELFGTPGCVLQAGKAQLFETRLLSKSAIDAIRSTSMHLAEQDARLLDTLDAGFIGFSETGFPDLLNHIPDPPLGLFYRGNPALIGQNQLAIVGSRSATPAGCKTAEKFARAVSTAGLLVTSGLATGIDSSAHRGCLKNGFPTIAVMGTGIDQVYPRSNAGLYQEICGHGVVVTEFAPGTMPRGPFSQAQQDHKRDVCRDTGGRSGYSKRQPYYRQAGGGTGTGGIRRTGIDLHGNH